jgi:16S rRNA processing protein RimM
MKNTESSFIVIGTFGSSYGIRGWIKINSFAENGPQMLEYQPWYQVKANEPENYQPIVIEDVKLHNNQIVIKLPDINTPEDARRFTGKHIYIQRSQLPDLVEGEYYWSQLIGLSVINKSGEHIGTVTALMETGSNDVLIVKGDIEFAIPYLPGEVILKVDLAKKQIQVDWEIIK